MKEYDGNVVKSHYIGYIFPGSIFPCYEWINIHKNRFIIIQVSIQVFVGVVCDSTAM